MKNRSINTLVGLAIIAVILLYLNTAKAEPYAGLYWLSGNTATLSGAETKYHEPGAALMIGVRTEGKVGAYGEFGLSGEGVILSGAGYAMTGPVEWSLGVTAIPDSSDGLTRLGSDNSNEYGVGPMIGVRYKWVSLRATRYDVDHNYNVTIRNDEGDVIDSASSASSARREVYWAGVVIPF